LARNFAAYQRQERLFSVLVSDIDRFKDFNDRHGHPAGDEVLRSIASVLHQTMRGTDVVARYGGEEFAVLMPGSPIEEARSAACRVREAVEQSRVRFEGQEFSVTTSIGVAQLLPNEHPSVLIGRADDALYAAKRAGRNLAYWHDGRRPQPVTREATAAAETPPGGADVPATPGDGATIQDAQPSPVSDRPAPAIERWEDSPKTKGDEQAVWCDRTMLCQHVRHRIAEWKRGGPSFSLLMVKVANCGDIAERYGQHVQDILLRAASRSLVAVMREMDVLANYAPGCFVSLLPGARLPVAIAVAQRAQQSANRCSLPLQDAPIQCRSCVGVAEVLEGDDVVRLLRRVEAAVDAAEKSGGDRVFCHNGQWHEAAEEYA